MKFKRYLITGAIVFASMFGLASCGGSSSGVMVPAIEGGGGEGTTIDNNVVNGSTTRKIYYTVEYSFTTNNLTEIASSINDCVKSYGGYVESSNENENGYGVFVYRVPTEKLNDTLNFIDSKEGKSAKEVKSTDITNDYVKLEQQIKVLKDNKTNYEKMLEDENLSVNDRIRIQDKLNEIDVQLNTLTILQNDYDSMIEYSKITVNFSKKIEKKSAVSEYFSGLGRFLVGFFKVCGYFAVPILCFTAIGFTINGIGKKGRKRRLEELEKQESKNKNSDVIENDNNK